MKPKITLRLNGLVVCLLSAATTGLGIADVATNWFTKYCQNGQGSCLSMTTDQALTWVAVGIWGPLQVFVTGLDAIYLSSASASDRSRLTAHSWFSAFVFTPAIAVISCVEIGFKFSSGLTPDTLATPSARAWFAVPLTIAVLGLLLHLLTLHLFVYTREAKAVEETEAEIAARIARQTPAPPPPPPAGPPCNLPQCDPGYVADADRLNVWAASRWMNQQGPAPTRTATALGNTNAGYYQYPRVVLAGAGGNGVYNARM